jgi:1-aminocyclopropane-1-carboxylate deaminase
MLSSELIANENVVVEPLCHPVFEQAGVDVFIVRLDLIDSIISGNKWFKLKHNIDTAIAVSAKGLLTFGGAYSNHLHAVAAAGKRLGLATIGILRGELHETPTPTLSDCLAWGMQLRSVSRAEYKLRNDAAYQQQLRAEYPGYYLIPEGGSNALAVRGVCELVVSLLTRHDKISVLVCPVGSGGTLAGCIEGVREHAGDRLDMTCQVLGYAALKGAKEGLQLSISQLLSIPSRAGWAICEDYHFGGFGKCPPDLLSFMAQFEEDTQIPLDPVYTAKMIYGLVDQVRQGKFSSGDCLMVLHTGGLQGRRGYL